MPFLSRILRSPPILILNQTRLEYTTIKSSNSLTTSCLMLTHTGSRWRHIPSSHYDCSLKPRLLHSCKLAYTPSTPSRREVTPMESYGIYPTFIPTLLPRQPLITASSTSSRIDTKLLGNDGASSVIIYSLLKRKMRP